MVQINKSKEEILTDLHDRWKEEARKRGKDPSIDQKRFETLESIQAFRFIQIGAAIRIQRAFRRWVKYNSNKWRRKYQKMILKYQNQKRLFQAIQKSKTIPFQQSDLDNLSKVKDASATVINRLVRGYLGRIRFKRWKSSKAKEVILKTKAILKLQAYARKIITWQRYPQLGARYRLFRKKQLLFHRQARFNRFIPPMITSIPLMAQSNSTIANILSTSSRELVEEMNPNRRDSLIYPEDFAPMKRRETILFLHLRLSSDFEKLSGYALIIQCAYRVYKAKNVFGMKFEIRKQRCLLRIQQWGRRSIQRHKILRFLTMAKPIWNHNREMKFRRILAAIRIQAIIRRFLRYRSYNRWKNKRSYSRQLLRQWLYYRACIRRIRSKIERRRYYRELSEAGAKLYELTELRWLCHYLWEGINKKTRINNLEKINHELQKIFTAHSLATGMDVAKAIKICKECKGLVKDDFSLSNVELQFMKVKTANEKRIDFASFLELLCNLMILKQYRIDPPKNLWEMEEDEVIYVMKKPVPPSSAKPTTRGAAATASGAGGKDPTLDNMKAPEIVTIKQLKQFSFGNFTGHNAFILKFVVIYLSTTHDYTKVVEYLGSKSASGQSQTLLTSNIRLIQQFVKNRLLIRQLNQSLQQYQQQKKTKKQIAAAKRIQTMVKMYLGRRFVMKIAQKVYNKFVDGETEKEYWFNPRTGQSYWTKPSILGPYDCGIAIRMPTDLEKYVVACSICEKNYSTCYCKDCQYCYCTSCYATNHRSGNRSAHKYLTIDNCIQCDFQIGTKFCYTCKDLYCDSCFFYMHKKGRLRFHSYQKYTELCSTCHHYAAQFQESAYTKGGIQISNYYCNKCYLKEYSILPAERMKQLKQTKTGVYTNPKRRYVQCRIIPIQYYGRQVREYHESLLEEKKKQEIQSMYTKRQEELAQLKRLHAIQTIQRVYRGYRKRNEIQLFLEERKAFLQLREEENQYRNAWTTHFLSLLGFPQTFQTDTPLERVHKLYPWYLHEIVAECIEYKWNDACQMLVEHDEYLKNKPKSTIWQYFQAKLSIYYAKQRYEQTIQLYDAKDITVNNANENYYNAEVSGAFAEGKLKKMKQAVNSLQKELKQLEQEKEQAMIQLAEAEKSLMDCIGPRKLQNLVEQRRKHGIPLPFKISIRKHSRYALVEYVDDASIQGDLFSLNDEELGVSSPPDSYYKPGNQNNGEENGSIHSHQPGEWKKKLKLHDSVLIKGIQYQIVPSMNQKKSLQKKGKKNKKKGIEEGSDKDLSDPGAAAAAAASSGSKKKKVATGSKKEDNSNSNSESAAKKDHSSGNDHSQSEGGGKGGGGGVGEGKEGENPLKMFDEPVEGQELKEELTLNHIVLDHPWMLEDAYGIEIYKLPTTVFYMKPIRTIQRYLLRQYITQKIIAILAIICHKWASLFQSIATFFDQETSTYAFCQYIITHSMNNRNYFLSLSIYIILLSFDFTLRRKLAKQLYRIYLFFAMIGRNIYNFYQTFTSNLSETPYEYWQRSLEKETLRVIYEMTGGESIILGEIRMDIKAPVEIMREYINRRFREKLNETIGESYLFMRINEANGKEEFCARDDEFRIYGKDFTMLRTDPKTYESILTVIITKDKERGKVFIPEFKDDFDDIGSLEKDKKDENADNEDNGSLV